MNRCLSCCPYGKRGWQSQTLCPRLVPKTYELDYTDEEDVVALAAEFAGRRVTKVDPEIIATRMLGQRIEYHSLSLSGKLLGASCPGKSDLPVYDEGDQPTYVTLDEQTIFIDSYLHSDSANAGRYHFTVAHEVSHKLLWEIYPDSKGDGPAARRIRYCEAPNRSMTDEERDADALAAAILMPPLLIRRKMEEHG